MSIKSKNTSDIDNIVDEMMRILSGREDIDESGMTQLLIDKYPKLDVTKQYLLGKLLAAKLSNEEKTSQITRLSSQVQELSNEIISLEINKNITSIDHLTGLPNYNGFIDNLSLDKDRTIILFHINDMFRINDAYSQQGGDIVIKKIGKMLQNFALEFPTGEVQVYRSVGTTFTLVFDGHISRELIEFHYDRVKSKKVQRYIDKIIGIPLSFSLGVASGSDIHSTVHNAEQALKTARRSRRRLKFHDSNDGLIYNSPELFAMRTHIKEVLEKDLFDVYVQEIIPTETCIKKTHKRKFECLLRVYQTDKKDSFVNLGKFLDVAKKDGRNVELTTKIIERVCHMMKGNDFHFSINLTEDDLMIVGGAGKIHDQILRYREDGITPDRMSFEILEDIGEGNIRDIQENLGELMKFGCGIAIDDFGAGYSNFFRLTIDVTAIKIDMSYIQGIDEDSSQARKHRNMVRTMVNYAHSEGIVVVAEGVETEGARKCLEELGVDYLQGYLFGRPAPLDSILSK